MEAELNRTAGIAPTLSAGELYELAKNKAWNVSADLDWERGVSLREYPLIASACSFAGFAPFEALPEPEKRDFVWRLHGVSISEIYHGENAALQLCAQILCCLPAPDERLFLCSQLFDEARHVEFFSLYLRRIGCPVGAPGERLRSLIEQADRSDALERKLLVCQLVIESLAMVRFARLRQETTVPLLHRALGYIARDEARHVNFGVDLLRRRFASLSDKDRSQRALFVLDAFFDLSGDTRPFMNLVAEMGWDIRRARYHLRRHRSRNAGFYDEALAHLKRNLEKLGLLTRSANEHMRRRVRAAGAGT